MTTINAGTEQAYNQIADNYLYLSLSNGDTIWGTDFASIGDVPPLSGGVNYQNLIHSMRLVDGEENNPNILKRYIEANQNASKTLRGLEQTPERPTQTIYNVLNMIPEVSRIKQIIDTVGYKNILNDVTQHGDLSQRRYTFFAPTNQAVDNAMQTWLKDEPKDNETPQPYTFRNKSSYLGLPNLQLRSILKAHTLGFNLRIQDTYDRKLELYTLEAPFSFVIDGTSRVVSYLNVYQKPSYLKNYQYPLPIDRFKVLKTFEVENGSLYIIDNMFSPQIVV
jgi:hypothetical protein